MSIRNITSASKYLRKELDKLEKEQELWKLKESVAHENAAKTSARIKELWNQVDLIEGKTTAFASL